VPLLLANEVKIRFDSVRDSYYARGILLENGLATSFIHPHTFAASKFQDLASVNECEGQLKIVVVTKPAAPVEFGKDLHELINYVCDFTGPIRKSEFVQYLSGGRFMFRVEYFSLDAANRLVQILKDRPVVRTLPNVRHSLPL
jgi:hypothetical protein